MSGADREGGLDAPTRHPLNQDDPGFRDEAALNKELERVFDICHGCRRCVSLCNAFPTLFDLVDESETMEVDGVEVSDYSKVVDQCYLCDLCYLTKCPYVPPHEWNVDFPQLMLRAKAIKFDKGDTKFRDRLITSTDMVGKIAAAPVVNQVVNSGTKNGAVRGLLDATLGIHKKARIPEYTRTPVRSRNPVAIYDPENGSGQEASPPVSDLGKNGQDASPPVSGTGKNGQDASSPVSDSGENGQGTLSPVSDTGENGQGASSPLPDSGKNRVALFTTCYCNYNEPGIIESLIKVLEHNEVELVLPAREHCCGMPKLELGDLDTVTRLKDRNIPLLHDLAERGYAIMAAVPSCVLMFKQQLPLMFPNDGQVLAVAQAFVDPFEYLHRLHKAGELRTDFKTGLNKVSYHVACHQRVQNIGPRTKQILELIDNTEVQAIERCSGHDGTYGVKSETLEFANKIARPIVRQIENQQPDYYGSDCPVAGRHIEHNLPGEQETVHPIELLRIAYGI